MSLMEFDAVILAGGRATRLGGIDKSALLLSGQRLVDRVVLAARNVGAQRVVAVGPDSSGTMADAVLREEPEFSGPLAAIAAALKEVRSDWVMILACDLQHPQRLASTLASSLTPAALAGDGAVLHDADGRTQWLAGIYNSQRLRDLCTALGPDIINAPVRRVLGELKLERLPVDNETSSDIDTPQALASARLSERKNMGQYLPPEALEAWLEAASKTLELDPEQVDIKVVLDVAKHVAHEVARPAAPLSTFLLGLAVGSGNGELAEQAAVLIERAHRWADEHPEKA